MTFRRLPAALPLAALVAVLAHLAGVGFDHAQGGSHAAELAVALVVALTIAALGAFFAGALQPGDAPIATQRPRGYPVWMLAGAGFAIYAAIELVEGHLALGGALRALLAVVPAAGIVGFASRCFGSLARRAGARFAGFARGRDRRATARPGSLLARAERRSLFFYVAKVRGRAPPVLA